MFTVTSQKMYSAEAAKIAAEIAGDLLHEDGHHVFSLAFGEEGDTTFVVATIHTSEAGIANSWHMRFAAHRDIIR